MIGYGRFEKNAVAHLRWAATRAAHSRVCSVAFASVYSAPGYGATRAPSDAWSSVASSSLRPPFV